MIMAFTFDFNISAIVSFLAGILLGFLLTLLVISMLILGTKKNKTKIHKNEDIDVSKKDIEEYIKSVQDEFKHKELKGEQSDFQYAIDLIKDMVEGIAKMYYPKSNHPLYEVSLDELLLIFDYTLKRIRTYEDKLAYKLIKGVKISTILNLNDKKNKIENNAVVRVGKKYKIFDALKSIKNVINISNPLNYAKRFAINKSVSKLSNNIILSTIAIIGEETTKIYSKSAVEEVLEINTNALELIEDNEVEKILLENEIEDVKEVKETSPSSLLALEAPKEEKKKRRLFRR